MRFRKTWVILASLACTTSVTFAETTSVTVRNTGNAGSDAVFVKVTDLNTSPNKVILPVDGQGCQPLNADETAVISATVIGDQYNLSWTAVDSATKQNMESGSCQGSGAECGVDDFHTSPVDPQHPPCP